MQRSALAASPAASKPDWYSETDVESSTPRSDSAAPQGEATQETRAAWDSSRYARVHHSAAMVRSNQPLDWTRYELLTKAELKGRIGRDAFEDARFRAIEAYARNFGFRWIPSGDMPAREVEVATVAMPTLRDLWCEVWREMADEAELRVLRMLPTVAELEAVAMPPKPVTPTVTRLPGGDGASLFYYVMDDEQFKPPKPELGHAPLEER